MDEHALTREAVLWKSLQEAADELTVLEARFPMWLKRAPECAPVLELVRLALEDLSQAIHRGLAS